MRAAPTDAPRYRRAARLQPQQNSRRAREAAVANPTVDWSTVPTLERINTETLRDLVVTFRDTVRAHAGGLNRLNVYPVPDGDTGTNMAVSYTHLTLPTS